LQIDSQEIDINKLHIFVLGPLAWIQHHISNNANPREILKQLMPELTIVRFSHLSIPCQTLG